MAPQKTISSTSTFLLREKKAANQGSSNLTNKIIEKTKLLSLYLRAPERYCQHGSGSYAQCQQQLQSH